MTNGAKPFKTAIQELQAVTKTAVKEFKLSSKSAKKVKDTKLELARLSQARIANQPHSPGKVVDGTQLFQLIPDIGTEFASLKPGHDDFNKTCVSKPFFVHVDEMPAEQFGPGSAFRTAFDVFIADFAQNAVRTTQGRANLPVPVAESDKVLKFFTAQLPKVIESASSEMSESCAPAFHAHVASRFRIYCEKGFMAHCKIMLRGTRQIVAVPLAGLANAFEKYVRDEADPDEYRKDRPWPTADGKPAKVTPALLVDFFKGISTKEVLEEIQKHDCKFFHMTASENDIPD